MAHGGAKPHFSLVIAACLVLLRRTTYCLLGTISAAPSPLLYFVDLFATISVCRYDCVAIIATIDLEDHRFI